MLARDLPVAVDLLGVAVASGCTPYLAIEHAARWAPSSVAPLFAAVPAATRSGVSLRDALDRVVAEEPAVRPALAVLETSARLGSPAASALARVGKELRADFRRRAESRARALSVRMIFPLVFLVLPAFVLLTVAPALINGFRAAGG